MQTSLKSIMACYFNSVTFFICLFFVSHGDGANVPDTLGYRYYSQISSWLKIHKNPTDWMSARNSCRQEDAFLAFTWTTEVISAVNHLQSSYQDVIPVLYSGDRSITTIIAASGCNDTEVLRLRESKVESCGVFYANGSTGYVDCKLRLPFVCYSSSTAPPEETPILSVITTSTPEPSCGQDPGYEYSSKTKHCYKMHIEVSNWSNANSTCAAENAGLAVPNSLKEVGVLTAIHNRYSDGDIYGTSWPDWTAVGIYAESNNWRTVDGQDLEQAGYEVWRFGWPCQIQKFPYVRMSRTGTYSNTADDEKYPFICEKPPPL